MIVQSHDHFLAMSVVKNYYENLACGERGRQNILIGGGGESIKWHYCKKESSVYKPCTMYNELVK